MLLVEVSERDPEGRPSVVELTLGEAALRSITTGNQNIATGGNALFTNTTGSQNTATGEAALFANTTGNFNTAAGSSALRSNTTGGFNVATGINALDSNTNGDNNTAIGRDALSSNQSGNGNLAAGNQALLNATGSRNVAIGPNAGINLTDSSRNVDIWNPGVAGESGTIRIGTDANQDAAFLAGVWNTTAPGPTKAVVVNSKGQLATATGPSPAAPLKSQTRTISHLRDRVRQQSAELRQQGAAIGRLRQQMQNGG